MFLLTFRVYLAPQALLVRLRALCDAETTLNGVLCLLQEWTLCGWYDFAEDPALLALVDEMVALPDPFPAGAALRDKIRADIRDTSACVICCSHTLTVTAVHLHSASYEAAPARVRPPTGCVVGSKETV